MKVFPVLIFAAISVCLDPLAHSAFTPRHLRELKNRTRSLFEHGWHSYMTHAFPADEVKPITCVRYGPQYTPPDDIHTDALGNVSSTVLDNLDSLIMMQEWEELDTVLGYLKYNQAGFFHQDYVVQVFEASIRWLGGLLSAHLALAEFDWKSGDAKIRAIVENYDGFLLKMAYDLGLRLIPAYKTSSNLPLPRINLAKGLDAVPPGKNREACTAGATTPFLEFKILSRLTGDDRFENLTRRTFDKLWTARSSLGLLPMSLDPVGSMWTDKITGIGASVDSFYEYSLKGAILFDDNHLWDVFYKSYQSLLSYSEAKSSADGWSFFQNIDPTTGQHVASWIDSLSAFWPGVQVLGGRLSDAVSSHLIFLKIWDYFDAIPERWETYQFGSDQFSDEESLSLAVYLEWYPLRPEFIESTYYLYRATRDPMYLQIGVRVLYLFENRHRCECGLSGYQNVITGEMQDRMETFVLGESLKYLYLLFDEANESYVHSPAMKNTNWVFSTEAHPFWLTKDIEERNQKAFRRFISHENTQLKKFKGKGLLQSMWKGLLSPSNELGAQPPIDSEGSPKSSRFGTGLRPAFEHLSVCETKPKQWRSVSRFLGSGYYNWDRLFSPEFYFAKTLVRPGHLKELNESNIIELSEPFLEVYGLSSNQMCALPSTTYETEFQIGALRRPEEYEMYKVSQTVLSRPFAVSDIVIPELSGRFRVEHLIENAINRDNQRVTRQYLVEAQPKANISTAVVDSEILRVNFLNGLEISTGINLWSAASYLSSNPKVFTITPQGDVYMSGTYVENLKAY